MMQIRTAEVFWIAAIVLAQLVMAGAVLAEKRTPAFSSDPVSVKSRLDNVRRLVTNSSGAKRIIESSNEAAKSLRNEAEVHLRAAEKAYDRGDMETAQNELQTATERMFAAVREIGTGQDGIDKQTRDFKHKAESVGVLLTAVERVAGEKGDKSAVLSKAKALRSEANAVQALADDGDVAAARTRLDALYEKAKLELEKLREGETLVRTLNFASAEEEYHYELDRNDTHQMLLKVLLGDKSKNAGMQKLIDSYVGRSTDLRTQAEGEAQRGEFATAVKSLEEATKYLQRAIRSAGVYIPG